MDDKKTAAEKGNIVPFLDMKKYFSPRVGQIRFF